MAKIATRIAYGEALADLVRENENIVVLDADLSGSTKSAEAKKVRPECHFNMGIAEGNMMAVAAGLAASDKVVFASSFAMFATGRAFEQIRNSICYPQLNVKVCASHAGLTVGEDGASHQTVEDISIMRSIPNMRVIQPCDALEAYQVIRAVAEMDGPFYVRLGRAGVEEVHDTNYKFEFGKGEVLHQGKDVVIFATGMMVQEALEAAKELNAEGIDPTIVNIHTIKPIDEELIIEMAKTHKTVITAEEHSVIGGLGSAVAEVLVKNYPAKVTMVGVQDTFGESGTPAALLEKYGLNAKTIVAKVKEAI